MISPTVKAKTSWQIHLENTPAHWKTSRLKFLAKICNGRDQKEILDDSGDYNIYGSGGIFGRGTAYLHTGPSVLLGRKGTIDKPLLVRDPFWTVDTMFYTEIEDEVDERFFYYHSTIIPFDLYRDQTTLPSMTQSGLGGIPLSNPPLPTQQKIADFLDRKTAQIDGLIEKKRQLIAKLKEKRLAVITQAVTCGLNPDAPLKDSGIEWLGQVPEHWITWKLTHAFGVIGSGTTPKSDSQEYYDGKHPWVTTSELRETVIKKTKNGLTKEALDNYSALKTYPKGAILFAMYGATIGRLGILGIPATVNQACCVFTDPERIEPKFLYYWLLMRKRILIMLSQGGGQPNLSKDDLKQIRIPSPTIHEQKEICSYLDLETPKIDILIELIGENISKLTEYRTALITAAVTGQLEVD